MLSRLSFSGLIKNGPGLLEGLQTLIPASSESVFLLLQEHKNYQNLVLQYLLLISTLEARQSGIH